MLYMQSLFRACFTTLQWPIALTMFTLAWNLKDPHFLPYRQFETATLLSITALCIALAVRRMRGVGRALCLSILAAAMMLSLVGEFMFRGGIAC